MRLTQPTLISGIMGVLLIIDEIFALNVRTTATEEYIAMAIAVIWPLLVWLFDRPPLTA